RTEKLSPVTPMVLRNSGRVGSRRFFLKDPLATRNTGARGFSRLGGGLEGIGGERRRMGDVRMERGEMLCSVTAQPASHISILTFSFSHLPLINSSSLLSCPLPTLI
ncbi:hypothetical protein, partial [Bacteroides salyersiae]|uniref:hypothetical protein n=1 Tax=Bacteroides salyersiae TaxID=291644 RepID=UPI00195F5492